MVVGVRPATIVPPFSVLYRQEMRSDHGLTTCMLRSATADLGLFLLEGIRVNYLDLLGAEIQRIADPDSTPPDGDLPLYRLYAVLLLAKGLDVTPEDVHNAWAAWASDHDPESRHLIPFKELSLSVQSKDKLYVDAIRAVAANRQIDPTE